MQQLGNEPTDDELAQKLDIEPQMVRTLRVMARNPISLQTKIGEDEDADFCDFVADANGSDPAVTTDRNLIHEQLMEVLATLSPREREVLNCRFGLRDGNCRTLEEIGRMFNVTRERARQIELKALRMLRTPTRMRCLRDYMKSA